MVWRHTYRGAEPQRVNKWLAQSGACSRREAEAAIAAGRVRIDGSPVLEPGHKILPGQTLELSGPAADADGAGDGAPIAMIIHKPRGLVSAQPEHGQIPAARLLRDQPAHDGAAGPVDPRISLAPLGRLDMDSRGLLLLARDGVLAKALIGPDSLMDKEYLVQVAGAVTPQRIALLRHGLSLDGRRLKPARVEDLGRNRLRFVLNEGRNRQIRRMAELVDLEVTDLLRVRIGPLALGDLPEGRWRPLKPGEREALIRASTGK